MDMYCTIQLTRVEQIIINQENNLARANEGPKSLIPSFSRGVWRNASQHQKIWNPDRSTEIGVQCFGRVRTMCEPWLWVMRAMTASHGSHGCESWEPWLWVMRAMAASHGSHGCEPWEPWLRVMRAMAASHVSHGCESCEPWLRVMWAMVASHASHGCESCEPWLRVTRANMASHASHTVIES